VKNKVQPTDPPIGDLKTGRTLITRGYKN